MTKLFTPTLAAALFFAAAAPSLSATVTIGETPYETLDAALKVVNDGETIQIEGTENFGSTVNPSGKTIAIAGKGENATINFTKAGVIANLNADGSLTFKDLTIDCSSVTTSATNLIQQSTGTLSLENVVINKFTSAWTKNPGILRVFSTPVATTMSNVRFIEPTLPEGTAYYINNAVNNTTNADFRMTLKGECDNYVVNFNQANATIFAEGVYCENPVTISFSSHTATVPVVQGSTDLLAFTTTASGKMLVPTDGNLYVADYKPLILVIDGTGTGYASLNDVVKNASADSKNIVYANEDIVYSSAANFGGMTVDFIALNPEANKITVAADKHLANASKANTILSFSGFTITQDLTKVAALTAAFVADVQGEGSSVTFDNVTFDGLNSTKSFIRNLNAGAWHLNNVTFTNCVADNEGVAQSFATANLGGNSVSGTVTGLSLTVNGEYSVDAKGLVAGPIEVSVPKATDTSDFELFTNCTNPDLFTVNNGYELKANANGGLNFAKATGTGIGSIEAAGNDSPAEYFTLDGRRVNPENLTSGLYIRRQNGKAVKIAIR